MWRHASRNGLVSPALDPRVVASIGRRLSLGTIIFVVSLPLAVWQPWITYVFWIGLFLFLFTTDWLTWQQATRTQQTTFPLDTLACARIHVQHGAGFLTIDSKAAENVLLSGVFGGGLESRMDRTTEAATIHVRAPKRRGLLSMRYPWSWGPADALDWTLHVSEQLPLALEIETSDGQATLELGAAHITDLKLRTRASATQIGLPDQVGTTTVHIEANSASLGLRVPPDVAAYIHGEWVTTRAEIDCARFPRIDGGAEYRSAEYETTAKRVDIRIDVSAGSVTIG